MKKNLITFSLILTGFIAFSQTPKKDLQLKDLGVPPANSNGPGKPDPKPADVPSIRETPIIKKTEEAYKNAGSPQPIIQDKKPVGGSVTLPY